MIIIEDNRLRDLRLGFVLFCSDHRITMTFSYDFKFLHQNQSVSRLYEASLGRQEKVHLSQNGALVCSTMPHTGRSARDKYVVKDSQTASRVHWNKYHKPFGAEHFEALYQRIVRYMQTREMFMQDVFVGAAPQYRLPVRIFTENAWHSLFAYNMFIHPGEREGFEPSFTLIQVPGFKANPERDHTQSEVFVVINFEKNLILIGGTAYAGEIKKAVFSVMNYLLPQQDVLPMHCSANQGKDGTVALFFGLSGTGKTTLSSDGDRQLIGDDEHGWGHQTVFNFEGGCYAKVIGLREDQEPEIYRATQRFGTILENTMIDETGKIDFEDAFYTENTRSSYPLEFIPNVVLGGIGGEISDLIFLTADAFGVLPPIASLTIPQTLYHFLSGYTARLAGTEQGVKDPEAVFSACFGEPFMPLHPTRYTAMLEKRLKETPIDCWLINTGWIGGRYGTGRRIPLKDTRTLIRGIFNKTLKKVSYITEPYFQLRIPTSCPNIDSAILNPQANWSDRKAYDQAASMVAGLFEKNLMEKGLYPVPAL